MAKGLQLFVFFMPSDLISSFFLAFYFSVFLGPAASKLAAAMLRGSQGCSALQAPLRFAFGLAFGHPSAALGRSS